MKLKVVYISSLKLGPSYSQRSRNLGTVVMNKYLVKVNIKAIKQHPLT